MLCYAMLCYAMLCYAMLCYAMLCYAMLCYAMLCYAMLGLALMPVLIHCRTLAFTFYTLPQHCLYSPRFSSSSVITVPFVPSSVTAWPKVCPVCNISMNSPQHWRSHSAGRKHLNKAKQAGAADSMLSSASLSNELETGPASMDVEQGEGKLHNLKTCAACEKSLSKESFSKRQLALCAKGKCKQCAHEQVQLNSNSAVDQT
eukprot:g66445.t1